MSGGDIPEDFFLQLLTSTLSHHDADTNITLNSTEETEPQYHGPERWVVPIVFGLIFLVGVIGNGTLIFTVLVNKNMRSTPNVLLVSLALGDLLLILISVPFNSTIYTFEEWPYGEAVCKLNEFLGALSLGVSVFTLTALSGERYMVIVHPMSSHRGYPMARTVLIAAGIWVVSAALGSLELFSAHVTTEVSGGLSCAVYPSTWGQYGQFHSMFRFLLYFAVPIAVIATFYALMARMLMISLKSMPGDGLKQQGAKQMEARKKVARLVLSFVIVFAVCWFPRHIYQLWFNYDPSDFNMFWHVFKITGFCLAFINSCVNPLALYFLSKQFRRYYDRYLFCCCATCRKRAAGGASGSLGGTGQRGGEGAGAGAEFGCGGGVGGSQTNMQIYTGRSGSRKASMPLTAMTCQTVC